MIIGSLNNIIKLILYNVNNIHLTSPMNIESEFPFRLQFDNSFGCDAHTQTGLAVECSSVLILEGGI